MLTLNTQITYPLLLILSNAKRSFEGLGRLIKKGGDTARRMLIPVAKSLGLTHAIARHLFKDAKVLTLCIDDTLISKIYSQIMQGAGRFFDTKRGKKIMSYRLMVAAITDGKHIIPIQYKLLFDRVLLPEDYHIATKLDLIEMFLAEARNLFPGVKIKIAMDGAFATIDILAWALKHGVELDVRMHRNRKVTLKNGQAFKVSEVPGIIPRGRQMARTIQVVWHGLNLYITAERRIDKHGVESVVFIVSTYKTRPKQYVIAYKKRWPIEKIFRTSKQFLGLQECFSTKLETQWAHIAAVFLAYSIAQLEMKNKGLKNPEEALRLLKHRNINFLISRFSRLDGIFGDVYA